MKSLNEYINFVYTQCIFMYRKNKRTTKNNNNNNK